MSLHSGGQNLGKAIKGASPTRIPAQNNTCVCSADPERGTNSRKETLQIQRKLGKLCFDPLYYGPYPCLLALYTHLSC